MSEAKKVVLVGEYLGEIPGVEIIDNYHVDWSLDYDECGKQLLNLLHEIKLFPSYRGVSLLFSQIPIMLFPVIVRGMSSNERYELSTELEFGPEIGVIITKPVSREDSFGFTFGWAKRAKEAVLFANPRAMCTTEETHHSDFLNVKVSLFEFDHIEWF